MPPHAPERSRATPSKREGGAPGITRPARCSAQVWIADEGLEPLESHQSAAQPPVIDPVGTAAGAQRRGQVLVKVIAQAAHLANHIPANMSRVIISMGRIFLAHRLSTDLRHVGVWAAPPGLLCGCEAQGAPPGTCHLHTQGSSWRALGVLTCSGGCSRASGPPDSTWPKT
eukprot:4103458-Prymnesium_polylepis.2